MPHVTSAVYSACEHCPPGQEQREGLLGYGVIIGALGALAAGLGLALVGVVMGWVWYCNSNSRQRSDFKQER